MFLQFFFENDFQSKKSHSKNVAENAKKRTQSALSNFYGEIEHQKACAKKI